MVFGRSGACVTPAHICLLYSGLFLNAVFLQIIGGYYYLIHNPLQLGLVLLICGALLVGGVYYVPARLGSERGYDLSATVQLYLGSIASVIVSRALVPIWAVSLFLFVGEIGTRLLDVALFHSETPRIQPGPIRNLFVGFLCFLVIVSAAKESRGQLARSAALLAKVSLAVILGLAISTARWWPDVARLLTLQELEFPISFHAHAILWAAPPLLLAGAFTRGAAERGRRSILLMGLIILTAMTFAIVAGMLTLAGTAVPSVRFRKIPDYIEYAYARPHQLGWVKVLVLALTTILAARFAASATARSIRSCPGWPIAAAVTGAMLAAVYAVPMPWQYLLWERAAIPFAPLGAVLCAAYLIGATERTSLTNLDRAVTVGAWSFGCFIGTLPLWVASVAEYTNSRSPWVIPSWLASFAITAAYFLLLKRLRATPFVPNPH